MRITIALFTHFVGERKLDIGYYVYAKGAINDLRQLYGSLRNLSPFLFLFLTALILSLSACKNIDKTWQRIEERGVLRIGLDPTYPPFEIAEGDAVYGLDVDLAHAIADDLGLSLEYVFFGFDGLYDGLSTDQVDVLISALVLAPEKTKDFAFTNSYFDAGQMLVTPLGSQIYEMTHLRGRSVATELGAQGHVIANNWKTIVPDLTIITFNSVNDALQAVTRGDTDAALADSVSARLFRQNEPGLQIADMPVTNEPYVLVVRAADEVLLKQLNGSIDRLQQSGILENIVAKWLDS